MKRAIFILLVVFAVSIGKTFAQAGLYQTSYLEYYNPSGDQLRTCYVWNSKTGDAIRYYYNDDKKWTKSSAELPKNPMGITGNEVGEIMMTAFEYYTPKGNQYRTIYYWNTKTGKSIRYYYSDAEKWEKSTAELVAIPIASSGKVGEITLSVLEYFNSSGDQNRAIMYMNTITGKSARYYYSEDEKWMKSDVALPDNPLN